MIIRVLQSRQIDVPLKGIQAGYVQIGGIGSGTTNHKYFSLSVQGVATKGCNGLQWLVQMQVVVQSKTKSKKGKA